MKRTFTYISISLIATAALFFFVPSSHAQDYTELNFESTELNEAVLQAGQTGTQLQTQFQTATQQAKKQTEACSSYGSTFTKPIECGLLPGIADLMLTFASKFLYLAGIFFNFSMSYTLNLANVVDPVDGALKINVAWSLIRDLVNIGFIFALLWIAIQTILEIGDWKRPLISIIIAALLINFSLFFTKVIIDVSNTFALQFYSSITGGQFLAPGSSLDGGISDQFVKRLKLTGIYKTSGNGSLSFGEISAVAIFGSIFLLVTAGVFFVAGLLFLARSAILIMLMVLSPIGFIGSWLPRFGNAAKDWWGALIKESLSAPVFLLIIWVVLKITDTSQNLLAQNTPCVPGTEMACVSTAGNATFADVFAGTSDAVGIVFNFLLLIAFTIFALNQAKSLSSSYSNSFTGWAQKKLGSGASGILSGTGWVGRRYVGGFAARLAENNTFRELAGKEGALGRLSMLGLRGVEGVAKSSFDARNISVPGMGGVASALKLGGADIDLGKAKGDGGFRKAEDKAQAERAKRRIADAKLLELKETDEEKEIRKEKLKKQRAEFEKNGEKEFIKKTAASEAAMKEAEKRIKEKYPNVSDADLSRQIGKSKEELTKEYAQQYAEEEAGKQYQFKDAKTITAERQRAYAKNIKPSSISTPLGPIMARTSIANYRGDLEAASKLEKSLKDSSKTAKWEKELDEKKKKYLDTLNAAFEEEKDKLKSYDDITEEHIEMARDKFAEMAARAEAEKIETLDLDGKARAGARAVRAKEKSEDLKERMRDIENHEKKIADAKEKDGKKDGEDKKDSKKDEEKKDDKK